MANTKHSTDESKEFRAGVAAALKALRDMEKANRAYNDLPAEIPAYGPDVQVPIAAALARAVGRLGEYERGFVTVLAELAFQAVLTEFIEPKKWVPYCAWNRREVEAVRLAVALAAKGEAECEAKMAIERRVAA